MSNLRIEALEQRVRLITKERDALRSANERMRADLLTATELGFDGLMRYSYRGLSARQIDIAYDAYKAGYTAGLDDTRRDSDTKKSLQERIYRHLRKYMLVVMHKAERGDSFIGTTTKKVSEE